MIICQDDKNSPNLINTHSEDNLDKKTSQGVVPLNHKFIASPTIPPHKISKAQGNNNLLTHPYKCKIVLRNMKSSLCYGVISSYSVIPKCICVPFLSFSGHTDHSTKHVLDHLLHCPSLVAHGISKV